MISYRFHKAREMILALADQELLGKTFSEGEFVLTVNNFFKGETATAKAIKELIKKASIINAVGKKATSAVIDAGRANEASLKIIEGIPHVQVIFIS